jgi:hypothetical protein
LEITKQDLNFRGECKMKIKKIISQHRRDFTAIYECEHCGYKKEQGGYDDSYYHTVVVPTMKCDKCKKTAKDDYVPMQTKYHDGYQV